MNIIKFNVSLLTFCFCVFLVYSCNETKEKKVDKLEEEQKALEKVENELNNNGEKIYLLAEANRLPFDTVYNLFRDFYLIYNKEGSYMEDALNYTVSKHSIAKSKAAALVFSYKYEMLTREEIFDDEISKYESDE